MISYCISNGFYKTFFTIVDHNSNEIVDITCILALGEVRHNYHRMHRDCIVIDIFLDDTQMGCRWKEFYYEKNLLKKTGE